MKTIAEVFAEQGYSIDDAAHDLYVAVMDREQEMADLLAVNAIHFGVHPPILAEVFATLGVGAPKSEEEKMFIHNTYVHHVNELTEAYYRDHPEERP